MTIKKSKIHTHYRNGYNENIVGCTYIDYKIKYHESTDQNNYKTGYVVKASFTAQMYPKKGYKIQWNGRKRS